MMAERALWPVMSSVQPERAENVNLVVLEERGLLTPDDVHKPEPNAWRGVNPEGHGAPRRP